MIPDALPEQDLETAEKLERRLPKAKWRHLARECRDLVKTVLGEEIYAKLTPLLGDVGMVAVAIIIARWASKP